MWLVVPVLNSEDLEHSITKSSFERAVLHGNCSADGMGEEDGKGRKEQGVGSCVFVLPDLSLRFLSTPETARNTCCLEDRRL